MPHIRDPVTGLCVVCDRGKRPVPYRQATRTGGIPEPNPPWSKIQKQSKLRKEMQMREKEDKALKVLLLNDRQSQGYLSIDQNGESGPTQLDRVLNPHSYHDLSHSRAPPQHQALSAQPLIKDPDNFNYKFSRSKNFSSQNGYIPSNRGSYHSDLAPQVVYVPVVKPEEAGDNWFQEYASHNAKLEEELQDPFYRNMAENPAYFSSEKSSGAQKLFDTATRRPSLQKPKVPMASGINRGGRPPWSFSNRPKYGGSMSTSSNHRHPHNYLDYMSNDQCQRSSSYPASKAGKNLKDFEHEDFERLNVEEMAKSSVLGPNKRSPTQRSVRFADEVSSQPRLFATHDRQHSDDSDFFPNQEQSRACSIL